MITDYYIETDWEVFTRPHFWGHVVFVSRRWVWKLRCEIQSCASICY